MLIFKMLLRSQYLIPNRRRPHSLRSWRWTWRWIWPWSKFVEGRLLNLCRRNGIFSTGEIVLARSASARHWSGTRIYERERLCDLRSVRSDSRQISVKVSIIIGARQAQRSRSRPAASSVLDLKCN